MNDIKFTELIELAYGAMTSGAIVSLTEFANYLDTKYDYDSTKNCENVSAAYDIAYVRLRTTFHAVENEWLVDKLELRDLLNKHLIEGV